MRPYLSSYQGRVYEFLAIGIEQTDMDYDILIIQNMENLRTSKLNSNIVHAPDGNIEVGDTIIRQYTREGVGLFGRYAGGYSSRGSTQYVDINSIDRWSEEHPIQANKNWIILIIFFLTIFLI